MPDAAAPIDVLYVAYNRLEFTIASFQALLDNTNWDLVRYLYVHDDDSQDGTRAYLADRVSGSGLPGMFSAQRFGGPVATMLWYLEQPDRPALFAKVDNDMVMPPGWLEDLYEVLYVSPELDILGTEPFVGLDTAPGRDYGRITTYRGVAGVPPYDPATADDVELPRPRSLGYTPATHIGGKGLLRAACFDDRPMWADGYQGFTQWQTQNEEVTKGWITPDLRSFGLDQLPLEPWASLTAEYVERGWQRAWPKYAAESHAYWDWWLEG